MDDGFLQASEPFALFRSWMADATASEPNDPNAATLATVDSSGLPNARIVLVKDADNTGFTFYTNFESQKGRELLGQPKAALVFHWKTLTRQVRVRGTVEPVQNDVADAYYQSRPRGSRLGAWASQQSRPMQAPDDLKKRVAELEREYGDDESKLVPRPPHWSGFHLTPLSIEFWHDRPYRLHDRLRFDRASKDAQWETSQLYP